MDRIFKRLNSTMSTVGEEYLYNLLRKPCINENVLNERQKLISFFQANYGLRKKLQYILGDMGKRRHVDISDYFYGEEKKYVSRMVLYRILQVLSVLSAVLMYLKPQAGALLLVPTLIGNILVYYKRKSLIGSQLESISYMVSLVNCAKKIINTDIKEVSQYIDDLKSSFKKIRGIGRRGYNAFYTNGDPFLEYIKIVFLKELIDHEYITSIIYKHKEVIFDYKL
jgi:DNA mismatch repair ATPase MutS